MEYPPGPSQKFPNQILLRFMQKPIETLLDFGEKYGDICHFRLGKYRHAYLLNNPEYIENILVQHPDNFIKTRALQISRLFLGNGLVTSEGEDHHQHRKLILPNFYPKQINKYAETMVETCVNAIQKWSDLQVIDIHKEMMKITLSIICKTALGSSIDSSTEEEVRKAVSICQDYVRERLMPYGEIINKVSILPINRKFQAALETLNKIVYTMVEEHRKNKSADNDLVSKLLQIRDENNSGFTDQQLRDEITTIFLAGHETTSNALTWTLYLLSQNPDIEELLYQEIKSVVGNDSPNAEDLPRLQFAEKIFRESMRIYPPIWTLSRQTVNDHLLDRYVMPAGSLVLMSQYVMHHNAKYFTEPECFKPDRWTRDFIEHMPRFSYFPFGGGIRSCVGESFAWQEGILLLTAIVKDWKMSHISNHKVILNPRITLSPKHGMLLKVKRR